MPAPNAHIKKEAARGAAFLYFSTHIHMRCTDQGGGAASCHRRCALGKRFVTTLRARLFWQNMLHSNSCSFIHSATQIDVLFPDPRSPVLFASHFCFIFYRRLPYLYILTRHRFIVTILCFSRCPLLTVTNAPRRPSCFPPFLCVGTRIALALIHICKRLPPHITL